MSFDLHGGTGSVPAQTVLENTVAVEPTEPTKAFDLDGSGYNFVGWFLDAEGTTAFNFTSPVTGNLTLHAVWSHHQVVRFNTKTSATIDPVFLPSAGGTLQAPVEPTREGFVFGGWFEGKPGLTWLDPQAVEFPADFNRSLTLHAYWEPVDSQDAAWATGETYFSTLSSTGRTILNPLTYEMSHENTLIGDLSTDLFSTEVDWDKAIADGVADFIGDFSKIEAAEFSIEALDYSYILVGATSYPKDADGDDHTVDGKYDRDGASQIKSSEWTFEIRNDIFFEDGTQVTADTFEYSLKQYLDPVQANFRSTSYLKDSINKNGYPIVGASEYRYQTAEAPVAWDTVGFEVVDDFTFTITTWEAISQAQAVGFGNMDLVQPAAYAASLNTEGTDSTYGTPANPYISYGPYVIKSWDENQRLVFNKNFDYVRKDLITYKSVVYEFTANVAEDMALFEAGQLSSVGLIGEYYAEYAENANVKRSWNGYPQYLILNYGQSKLTENPLIKNTIMLDTRFRQALFFGFNRALYASTVYAPNTPSVMPVPLDTKGYIQDPLYFSESPDHLAVLEAFGITEGTDGFLPERAIDLFDAALADYKTANPTFTGPVTLKFITSNDALSVSLVNWIKNQLETLFGTENLLISVVEGTTTSTNAARAAWDFDLILMSLGFGSSSGVQWQYPGIAFLGGAIGAAGFGLHLPFEPVDGQNVDISNDPESWLNTQLDIDLSVTLDYLVSKGEDWIYEVDDNGTPADTTDDVELHPGHIWLYEALLEDGEKAAGIFNGTLYEISDLVFNWDTPYDGTAIAPFPGATQEVWKIVAAMEEIFFEQMPLVPTVTRSSATLYAENVTILWPKYSAAFGWGAGRYRFLNSDADFEDGLFNSFAVEAE